MGTQLYFVQFVNMPQHKLKHNFPTGKRLPTYFKNGWIIEDKIINGYLSQEHASKKKTETVTKVSNFNTVILNDNASEVFPELKNLKPSSKIFPDDDFKTVFRQMKNKIKSDRLEVEYINYFDVIVAKTFQTKDRCTNIDAWNIHTGTITMETSCFYSILKLHRCAEIQNKPWHTDTTITGIEKYHNKITKNQWGVGTSEGTHQSHEVSINYQNDNWYFSKTASKQNW